MLNFLWYVLVVGVVVFLTIMLVVLITYMQGRGPSWEREASREKLQKGSRTPAGPASKTAGRRPGPRSRKGGG